jgi:2-dehydropantoate 2-reductase
MAAYRRAMNRSHPGSLMNSSLPPPKPVLSIAVVGVGAIGSTFAYHLARAGHDVTAIARPDSARLRQLQRDEWIVLSSGQKARLSVADQLDEDAAYDLVLVTTLAHQVDAVLPALGRSKAAAFQFMFNTFDPGRLSNAIGQDRCSFGMPFVMATLGNDGTLESKANPGQKTLHGDARWAELFSAANLPSAFEADMTLWLRCHAPMCIAMESICVTGLRRGSGATWREAIVVARGLQSGFGIIRALGYPLYPRSKSVLASCPVWLPASMLWLASRVHSFRLLLSQGLLECRALADVLASAATEAKAPVPGLAANVLAMKPRA